MVTCPHKPELLKGVPIGMYHCPCCGMIVIAGLPHGESDGCIEFDNDGNLLINGQIDPEWRKNKKLD